MRILVLNYEFPPVGGGGGRASCDVSRHLAARGHVVHVLTSHVRGLPHRVEMDGMVVERVFAFRGNQEKCSIPGMAGYVLSHIIPARRRIRAFEPDVVHVHFGVPTGAVAFAATRFSGVPYVVTGHLGDVPGGAPEETDSLFRMVKPLTVPIWRSAAAVTAVNHHVAALVRNAYRVPVTVIHNGVDLEDVTPSPPAAHAPPRMIFAGRMVEQKRPVELLGILGQMTNMDWELDMYGDGDLMPRVRDAAARPGLRERVRLHGWVDPATVIQGMSRSDILLLPSRYEGLSVAGVMGLASGLAVFASDVPGNSSIVASGENGYSVPVDSTATCVSALRAMLDPVRLAAMKAASRKRALQYDLKVIAAQYEECFNRCLRRKSFPPG